MRFYVVSDGTSVGTRVMDRNGKILEGVQKITITVDAQKAMAKMVLEVVDFDLEIEVPEDKTKINVKKLSHAR